MLVWLFLLGLSSSSVFPPDDSILLLKGPTVRLYWKLPGRRYQVSFYQNERLLSQVTTTQSSCPVSVEAGGSYHWSVSGDAGVEKHRFQVADGWVYHADGRAGSDALPGREGGTGGNGRDFTVELLRGAHGMNLFLRDGLTSRHYVFCEPGRFRLTSRGGDGGRGAPGVQFSQHSRGWNGGASGFGGNIRVITHTVPWREFLDIDVEGGMPGRGGAGAFPLNGTIPSPAGVSGPFGRGGKVETFISEP